jgi:hypothetical protein
METSRNLTGQNTGEQLTFFQEDSLANPSAPPGSEKASQMTAISGRNILGLYERFNRPMLLARMLLASSRWTMAKHLKGYSLIWRAKDTKWNRSLFQLAVSGRGTEETGFGFWRTPEAGDSANRTFAVNSRGEPNLSAQVKLFPTPRANDSNHSKLGQKSFINRGDRNYCAEVVMQMEYDQDGNTGQLNPEWVEGLMGFPFGYTDIT